MVIYESDMHKNSLLMTLILCEMLMIC